MPELKEFATLSAALLTPVISVITVVIVVFQYSLARQKWRLDLFEKRYVVYRAAADYLASIMRQGTPTAEAQNAFIDGTRDRGFLFGPEVASLLDEIWSKTIDLETHQDTFRGLPVGDERTTLVKTAGELKKEMPKLYGRVHEAFGAYLRITEK